MISTNTVGYYHKKIKDSKLIERKEFSDRLGSKFMTNGLICHGLELFRLILELYIRCSCLLNKDPAFITVKLNDK